MVPQLTSGRAGRHPEAPVTYTPGSALGPDSVMTYEELKRMPRNFIRPGAR